MSKVPERIEPEFVGIQPTGPEILSALFLYSFGGIPQDETRFAQGIKAAAEVAPFLSRFIDPDTGGLTDYARSSMEDLQKGVLLCKDGIFKIDPARLEALNSSTRMCFKDSGIEFLKVAAGAAQRVWFPRNPQ